ncbi:uncharacterized protein LOC126894101 [Daktulosphaira vitifoliae]|uniref:uncharacterized protein LOC126894101 n=1 Tax=Daktulosphaira vitifoliae TaxID=58002 RepID=UPI0021AA4B01|nr:uncharacterized protein LOC126894101 [Daktulosphaira vitifoliae]
MEFYSITFVITAVFALKPNEAKQCLNYRDDYKNYIKTIIYHIYSQILLNEKQNLNQGSNNTTFINKVFSSETNTNEFRDNYSYTINILNFKYTEILKNFLDYINVILHKCKQFQNNNLSENFISCVTLLVEEVKNSKTMFENLYKAMKYISDFDVRYVFQGKNVPNAIIDEIDFFKEYVSQKIHKSEPFDLNKLPYLNDSETNFKNLNEFYTEATIKVNNLFQNSNIINTSVKTNSATNQIKECYNENDSNVVYLTCRNLNAFYDVTIEIWYKNLGFEQFLNPRASEFIPPITLNQLDGIKALNILRQETGWKNMEHINIIYNFKRFNVNYVIKDEINIVNFQIKATLVTQILRCRYTEIIKNYYTLLTAIVYICDKSDNDNYRLCLIELYNSFHKSKLMLQGLHLAIITLNKLSIWTVSNNCQSNVMHIIRWVSSFLRLLKNSELYQDINSEPHNIKITLAQKLKREFAKYRIDFRRESKSEFVYMKTRCIIREPFYDKFSKINEFNYLTIDMKNAHPQYLIQKYHTACKYLNNFCEDAYKSCYEDLGFKKVDCGNKSIDIKLNEFTVDLVNY